METANKENKNISPKENKQVDGTNESNISSPKGPDKFSELKKEKRKNKFLMFLFAALIFYGGYVWGSTNNKNKEETSDSTLNFIKNLSNPKELFKNSENESGDKELDFDIFWKVWKEVDKNYVDENRLNSQQRLYGAIKGMVNSVGDPYSVFFDPQESRDFNTEMEGSFEGIGAELGIRDDILTVVAPIDGMPAQKAGLRAGDKIFKIDGEMTSDLTIDDAVNKIRGPKGTDVTLTIVRNGDSKTQDITIIRGTIELKSVSYEKKEDGIGYVRISKFSQDTDKEFNKEATKMLADNVKGIVLDLRNNPGGYLDVSVKIASKFIPKDKIAVIERGRDGKENNYKTLGGDIFSEIPIVVLINEGSASASEILAGALRDDRGIKLIGEKSFGKGSVQTLEDFNDGSSLKVTIAKWFTPSGQSIHEVGLEPDIKVELTDEDIENQNDSQLNRAMEEIKSQMNVN